MEVIKTEYMTGKLGADYGSKTRVVMRSPKALLFVGYGLNLVSRANAYRYAPSIAPKLTISALSSESVVKAINDMFGEGAAVAALKALERRGFGTVLFDGGGDPMPLPEAVRRENAQARYDAVTPTATIIPEDARTCVQCGGPLPLHTVSHRLNPDSNENTARKLDDVQKLTNHRVVRVRGEPINSDEKYWPQIIGFETWDGVSYRDDTFCSTPCAANYGRRAAADLPRLAPGIAPLSLPTNDYEIISHYDTAAHQAKVSKAIEDSFRDLHQRIAARKKI